MKRYGFWILFLVGAAVLAVLPLLINAYWVRVGSEVLMWVAMAQALNIILGLAGYPAFGNGAFMGVGAYTTAILMNAGAGFWIGLLGASLISGALAALIGFPVLRLKGHYFAIATVGINFALLSLVGNLSITGGGSGLTVPLFPGSAEQLSSFFYYAFAAVALLSVLLVYVIRHSAFGYALRAIHASEEAAGIIGINTALMKVLAWIISAVITGLVGGIYAYWNGFLDPGSLFDIVTSVELFIMVLLGGAGTVLGPIIGAVGIEAIAQYLWSALGEWHLAVLGLVILLVGVFMPRGLLSLLRSSRQKEQDVEEEFSRAAFSGETEERSGSL